MSEQIFRIGDVELGDGRPCCIVAELSGNHGQSRERAFALVRSAAQAGADAIKLQAYTADTITLDHDGADFRIPADTAWQEHGTLHRLYQQACTPWEWIGPLCDEARSLGMEAFCSVFDHSSVEYLERSGATAWKIAAPEITDVPLLRRVAQTGVPVVLSSGLAAGEDLQLAVDTLRAGGCRDILILKCTSEYPAPIEKANLSTIPAMRERYGCLAGLSDHTTGTSAPVVAVALGAALVEKHFTLDEADTVDSFFSLRPAEFASMVEEIRRAEAAIGTVDFAARGRLEWRRSLYACAPVRAGERFSPANVRSVRPAGGLHPRHWDELMTSVATRDIAFGEALHARHVVDGLDRSPAASADLPGGGLDEERRASDASPSGTADPRGGRIYDIRPREERPGEERRGEERPGEERRGEERPGEESHGDDRPCGDGFSATAFDSDLDLALAASRTQPARYRPTSFWAEACLSIARQMRGGGVERFRRLPLPLTYFVPTYGMPGNGFAEPLATELRAVAEDHVKPTLALDRLLHGQDAALADYRVLCAADDRSVGPDLHRFSESDVGDPCERIEFEGRRFSRSSLNYLLGLCFLKRHLQPGESIDTVLEIGGGFGSLGEILLSDTARKSRYVDLDIPPNNAITEYYLSSVLGADRVTGFRATREQDLLAIDTLPPASALCNWQIETLVGEVDLFVNFISFQEMEPDVVQNYLTHVDRLKARWILLRNLREGKQRRTADSVGVEHPIRSQDYLRMLPGYTLAARTVLPFGYRTVDGFHSELLLLRRQGRAS